MKTLKEVGTDVKVYQIDVENKRRHVIARFLLISDAEKFVQYLRETFYGGVVEFEVEI